MIPLLKTFCMVMVLAMGAIGMCVAQQDSFAREDLNRLEAAQIAAQMRLDALEAEIDTVPLAPRQLEQRLSLIAKEISKHNQQLDRLETALDTKKLTYAQALKVYETQKSMHQDVLLHLVMESKAPPPPPLALVKTSQAVRTLAIMQEVRPRLVSHMIDTRILLAELSQAQADLSQARDAALLGQQILETERRELDVLIGLKRQNFAKRRLEIEAARAEVNTLAIQAETLGKLIADIEARAPLPPSARAQRAPSPFSAGAKVSFKTLQAPLAGSIIRRFGQKDDSGLSNKGVYISAQSSDLVLAPIAGVVVFAEPYRGFGHMIILRVSQNQHIIMHGMDNLFAEFGEKLNKGQPIGRMPSRTTAARPQLYLEVRDNDVPVDPEKWIKS